MGEVNIELYLRDLRKGAKIQIRKKFELHKNKYRFQKKMNVTVVPRKQFFVKICSYQGADFQSL